MEAAEAEEEQEKGVTGEAAAGAIQWMFQTGATSMITIIVMIRSSSSSSSSSKISRNWTPGHGNIVNSSSSSPVPILVIIIISRSSSSSSQTLGNGSSINISSSILISSSATSISSNSRGAAERRLRCGGRSGVRAIMLRPMKKAAAAELVLVAAPQQDGSGIKAPLSRLQQLPAGIREGRGLQVRVRYRLRGSMALHWG